MMTNILLDQRLQNAQRRLLGSRQIALLEQTSLVD